MNLTQILLFGLVSILAILISHGRWRGWMLLGGSILAIYWIQPSTPIRHLDFWLPTTTLALSVLVWAATRPAGHHNLQTEIGTAAIIAGIVLGIGLTRYLEPVFWLIPSRPPALPQVLLALGLVGVIMALLLRFPANKNLLSKIIIALVLSLFIILKSQPLAQAASSGLRAMAGQSVELASALNLRWLGFSYVAFRMLHTLSDRLRGRLPDLSLQEYVIYIIFFPAFTAGPIDRVQRFTQDLRKPFHLSANVAYVGGKRLILGIFTKFVLADSLAVIALNDQNAGQITSSLWLWFLLYAYALRIYFDFAGYTNIAIGLGQLLGFHLPENFKQPYRQSNLTMFWNSWHITLAQWFRAYFFNPFTRALRSNQRNIPLPIIILLGQLGTMILIGLWHGITWNFIFWGLWHGIGLFAHNRWSEAMRPRIATLSTHPLLGRSFRFLDIALTFHYVTLGWIWFALPAPEVSWNVLLRLFGMAG